MHNYLIRVLLSCSLPLMAPPTKDTINRICTLLYENAQSLYEYQSKNTLYQIETEMEVRLSSLFSSINTPTPSKVCQFLINSYEEYHKKYHENAQKAQAHFIKCWSHYIVTQGTYNPSPITHRKKK